MSNSSQGVRSYSMCVKHIRACVITAKPSRSFFFQANRGNRTELFALLDLIQPHSGPLLERRGKNRTVTQSAGADFIFATHPSENEIVGQHVGNHFIVRLADIVLREIKRAGRDESKARINVPIDLRIASEMQLAPDPAPASFPRSLTPSPH